MGWNKAFEVVKGNSISTKSILEDVAISVY